MKRGWVWAVLVVFGCSDDGVPADTDVAGSVSGAAGVTSDSGAPGSSGGDSSDPSGPTDPSVGTSTDTADPTGNSGSTGGPTGDSSSGGVESPGEPRLYVSGGNAVSVWSIDEAGVLTSVQTFDQATTVGPIAQVGGRFLYGARVDEQAVSAMSIDPSTGELTEVGVTAVGHRPVYLSVAPSGGWLLSADFGADLVQLHPIGADGTVEATPSQSLAVQSRPHAIVFDPGGGFVFVPHRDANLVEQYVFDDATGMLTPNDPPSVPLPEGAGARHIAFAPDASHAYVVNEFSSSVTAFTYDAVAGLLTAGDTVSALPPGFEGENTGADVHVSSDGANVYASMRGNDALAVFSTGPNAGLTYVTSVDTEPRPREFGLDPFGNFVYAAGQDSGMLASYTIEADGNLTPGPVYAVGDNPLWVLGVELPTR